MLLLSALACAGCVESEPVTLVTQARVQWKGTSEWVDVDAPRRLRGPGEQEVTVEWRVPPLAARDAHASIVANAPVQVQVDDGPPLAMRQGWNLVAVPGDGQPHRVRTTLKGNIDVFIPPLPVGAGVAPFYRQFVAAAPWLVLSTALALLGAAMLVLSWQSRSRAAVRAVGVIALSVGFINFTERSVGRSLFDLSHPTWVSLHEIAMPIPIWGLTVFMRSTVGDTRRRALWWVGWGCVALIAVDLALAFISVPLLERMGGVSYLLTFAGLFAAAAVAIREANKGSQPARPIIWGLAVITVSVIPSMLVSVRLVPDMFVNFSPFGLVFFMLMLALSLAWADRERDTALRQRLADLERSRSEIESLNIELKRQVAEKSRALAGAMEMAAPQAARLPEPGEVFNDRYRIVRAVGKGGMGAVFEVERVSDQKPFALKLMIGAMDGDGAARFLREAEIAARLSHPNLVSVVDVGTTPAGVLFLVMELVPGQSLERLEAKWKDRAWSIEVLRQIAEGVAALHGQQVVHRDLKPANVLVFDEGGRVRVKLSDFGIARLGVEADPLEATAVSGGVTPSGPALTQTGTTMGTPRYLAPDVVGNARASGAHSDAFSFGVMACELLCGTYPFVIPPALEAMAGRTPTPADLGFLAEANLGAALKELLARCLSLDPAQRPRAEELAAALRGALAAA